MKLYFVLLMKSHLQSYPCPLQTYFTLASWISGILGNYLMSWWTRNECSLGFIICLLSQAWSLEKWNLFGNSLRILDLYYPGLEWTDY